MHVFIDLRPAQVPGANFAFLDTITMKFVHFANRYVWETWRDLQDDINWVAENQRQIGHDCDMSNVCKRVRGLCPRWVFDLKED